MLVVSERRDRIARDRATAFLATLADLPIEIEEQPPEAGVIDLARRLELSVYDAAYLELAVRTQSPLATLDDGLRRAAGEAGVSPFAAPG